MAEHRTHITRSDEVGRHATSDGPVAPSTHVKHGSDSKKHVGKSAVALVLSFVLACMAFPAGAMAETSSEVRARADALMEKLDSIQTQINETTEVYNNAVAAHDAAVASMNAAQERENEAQARVEQNQQKIDDRAVSIYKRGQVTLLDVLLGADSFDDFVNLSNMVEAVQQRDADLVSQYKADKAEAQAAREEYNRQQQEAQKQMQTAQDAYNQLQQQAAEMQSQIDTLTAEAAQLQAQEEAQAEAARQAEEQARQAEEAAKKQQQQQQQQQQSNQKGNVTPTPTPTPHTGRFTHPCPSGRISSSFGYRSFDNSFHKGVDFAASQGSPIYAAASGTVLIAGYSATAGNWVVISHGNGLVTKYMHMAKTPFVRAGQSVSAGTNIGVVGSTGNSTGPHLHFQVELNGVAVNPMNYL